jgi:uncharacterized membrane-anchored protein YhcB (DUF1043 family)
MLFMKKFFGVIILLAGLFLIAAGAAGMSDANSRHQTFDGQVNETFSNIYRERNAEQRSASTAAIVAGLILSIVGIVMLVTKTKKQRKQETELALLKTYNNFNRTNTTSTHQSIKELSIPELFTKFVTSYQSKDFDSCISSSKQILSIDPTNYKAYFNIAKIYSRTQFNDEFQMLQNAVDNGLKDKSKINEDPDFNWIKKQNGFKEFIEKNSYKDLTTKVSNVTSTDNFDDRIAKIEKLGKLKEQGLLSEEEFQKEKLKILA